MPARGLDVVRRRVDARHLRAEPRQRLGDEPAAAADVQDRKAVERPGDAALGAEMPHHPIAQEGQARRTDQMQGAEFSVRHPTIPRRTW